MQIGNFNLDQDIFIIAEIGNNHEGNYALAEEMIGLAAKSGASAVKFQTIIPEKLVSVLNADRIEQLKKFQLTYEEFEKLSQVARQENVLFLSTPFDIESAKFLSDIVPAFKISSGDNNFYPLIECVAMTGKPIIFSTGLSNIKQIKQTKEFIEGIWREMSINQQLAILHCVSRYPTPMDEANLGAIKKLKELNVPIGYSDHTLGIEAAIFAAVLGARIIEKHFTIDKNYSDFHDHQLSADPEEFARMVSKINNIRKILGREKDLQNDTLDNTLIRRSIVASRDLAEGTVLSLDDISWVRPGGGLRPGMEENILNKKLTKSFKEGEIINEV